MWALRLVWAAQVLLAAPALGQALDGRSRPVQLVALTGAWSTWFVALVALLLPSALSLTTSRMILAGWLGTTIVIGGSGASPASTAVAVGGAALAAIVCFSGEVGQAFVQGSAYGDERRLPLRPPGPLLLGPIPLLAVVTFAASVAGPLLLAAKVWWGAAITAAAVALVGFAGRRFHVLSCRWLVFVPAGLVVHDGFVLAETAMFRRAELEGVGLADAATEAADLTGAALGPAVEVRLAGTVTVVLAPTRGKAGGTALHLRSFLVSPTRPGRALAEARRRSIAG